MSAARGDLLRVHLLVRSELAHRGLMPVDGTSRLSAASAVLRKRMGGDLDASGAHVHVLDRRGCATRIDGAHRHLFVLPDGSVLWSEEDGQHGHELPSASASEADVGGLHVHRVRFGDGTELLSSPGGAHRHALLAWSSDRDGGHGHDLRLGGGGVAQSFAPATVPTRKASLSESSLGIALVIGRRRGASTTSSQSVLFDRARWSEAKARTWLDEHGFHSGKLDETPESLRFRQAEPEEFQPGSMRTIFPGTKADIASSPEGIGLIVGRRRGQETTSTQAVLFDPDRWSEASARAWLREHGHEQFAPDLGTLRFQQADPGAFEPGGLRTIFIGMKAERLTATSGGGSVPSTGGPVAPALPDVRLIKRAGDEQFVLGIVLVPEETDKQGDVYSDREVERACHYWAEYSLMQIGDQHQARVGLERVKVLENFIARSPFEAGGETVKAGTWCLAVRVIDPALWSQVKDGKRTGYSIGGVSEAIGKVRKERA